MTATPPIGPQAPGSRTGSHTGMRIGVLAGSTSWIVILGLVCLCTGRFAVLLPIVLPLLLASLGIGLLVVLLAELAAAEPRWQSLRGPLVLGAACTSTGLLLLLIDAWVSPMLEGDPGLAGFTRMTGGVARLPRWLAAAALALGCTALLVALRRRRDADAASDTE